MADTQLTDENLITSFGRYLADKFVESGWAVYWQATDISSGTATFGEITLVPEFPPEVSVLVLPPRTRKQSEILLPAFSVSLLVEPYEEQRAGLGDSEFFSRASLGIDGFAVNQSQHMAFATMFRNWFKDGTRILIYDYEADPVDPPLIDRDVLVDRRTVDRLTSIDPNIPRSTRYYISTQIDISFLD